MKSSAAFERSRSLSGSGSSASNSWLRRSTRIWISPWSWLLPVINAALGATVMGTLRPHDQNRHLRTGHDLDCLTAQQRAADAATTVGRHHDKVAALGDC